MSDSKRALERFAQAKKRRSPWEDLWDEIYSLMLPMQEGYFQDAMAEEGMDEIFDETAVVAIQQFANQMQFGSFPSFTPWFRFEPGSEIPFQERPALQAELDNINEYLTEIFQNSNLSQAVHESFLDLAVGTGNMLVREGFNGMLVDFDAVSQTELYLLPGPHDTIADVFRLREVKHRSELKIMWPDAVFSAEDQRTLEEKPDSPVNVLEWVYRDWSEKGTETWRYMALLMDSKNAFVTDTYTGEGSSPWLNFRWSHRPGEVWGRGPAIQALPATRTANLLTKLTMENADIQIGGMWQVDDDGVINTDTIELVSGSIVPVSPNTRGLQSITPGGNVQFGDVLLSQQQEHIRKAFFSENLGNLQRTPRSAIEVDAREGNRAEEIGAALGRVEYEFTNNLLRRTLYILKQQGRVQMPRVNGREIKVRNISPLGRAMRSGGIQQTTAFFQTVLQSVGPEKAKMYVKEDEYVAELADHYEIPERMLMTQADRDEAAAKIGEASAVAGALPPEVQGNLAGAVGG